MIFEAYQQEGRNAYHITDKISYSMSFTQISQGPLKGMKTNKYCSIQGEHINRGCVSLIVWVR